MRAAVKNYAYHDIEMPDLRIVLAVVDEAEGLRADAARWHKIVQVAGNGEVVGHQRVALPAKPVLMEDVLNDGDALLTIKYEDVPIYEWRLRALRHRTLDRVFAGKAP